MIKYIAGLFYVTKANLALYRALCSAASGSSLQSRRNLLYRRREKKLEEAEKVPNKNRAQLVPMANVMSGENIMRHSFLYSPIMIDKDFSPHP